jgi:hypothetical protein
MQSSDANDPTELFSAAFDGEYAGTLGISESQRSELEAEWTSLRSQLQALPIESANLLSAVHDELQPAVSIRQHQTKSRLATLVAIGTIAVAVVVVALPLLRHSDADRHAANIIAFQESIRGLSIDPLHANCNVVIVNVDADSSMEDTVRNMLGAAEVRGAQITSLHSVADEGAEYSAGFLLTAGTESQVIVDSLADEHEQLDWNPADIDGRSPEEIKSMFLASMAVPTKSDKVFGAMYVVDEVSLVVSSMPLPASEMESPRSVAVASSDVVAADTETVARAPESPVAAPLIVIFRKQFLPREQTSDPEQSELPRIAAPQPTV